MNKKDISEKRKFIIGTILAILAIFIAIVIAILSNTQKELNYQITSSTELINSKETFKDLEVLVAGKKVTKASVYSIKVINSGDEPVKKSDFDNNISIYFDDKETIYRINIKKTIPNNLALITNIDRNSLNIYPLLLNPKDEFEIEILSSSLLEPMIDSRIIGINKIEKELKQNNIYLISIVIFFMFLMFLRTVFQVFSKDPYFSNWYVRSSNILIGLMISISALYLYDSTFEISYIEGLRSELRLWLMIVLCSIVSVHLSFKDDLALASTRRVPDN